MWITFILVLNVLTNHIDLVAGNHSKSWEHERSTLGRGVQLLQVSAKIIGGTNANPNEFPYQLAMELGGDVACGAVIVNEYYAISAAHCTNLGHYQFDAENIKLIAGEHSLKRSEGKEQRRNVVEYINHEKYGLVHRTYYNDISVLKVDKPFVFNKFVQPIDLAPPKYEAKGIGIVTGWGVTNVSTSSTADKLQKVKIPIITDGQCKKTYEEQEVYIIDNQLCAGYMGKGGKDACQGDSGGPLIVYEKNKPLLVGIVSFGANCAHPEYPGIYTEIAKFRSWIDPRIKIK